MAKTRVLYITATDTGVGKTVLGVLLIRHLRFLGLNVLGLKPVESGGRSDSRALYEAQERRIPMATINPWHWRAVLAPSLAARRRGYRLDCSCVMDHIRTVGKGYSMVLVEGAGGLLSPLGEGFDSRDLVAGLRAKPCIVAPNRLGVVHQVRATLAALPKRARTGALVVLSGPDRPNAISRLNARLLSEYERDLRIISLPWWAEWKRGWGRKPPGLRGALEAVGRSVACS